MLALEKIKEVERLLAQGTYSQRQISRLTGVSRATIGGIASGRRPDYEAMVREKQLEDQPPGPLARCPGCGGLVYTPCRLCRVRALKEKENQVLRNRRRAARRQALDRLLAAVAEANGEAKKREQTGSHLPPTVAGGASDCR